MSALNSFLIGRTSVRLTREIYRFSSTRRPSSLHSLAVLTLRLPYFYFQINCPKGISCINLQDSRIGLIFIFLISRKL